MDCIQYRTLTISHLFGSIQKWSEYAILSLKLINLDPRSFYVTTEDFSKDGQPARCRKERQWVQKLPIPIIRVSHSLSHPLLSSIRPTPHTSIPRVPSHLNVNYFKTRNPSSAMSSDWQYGHDYH